MPQTEYIIGVQGPAQYGKGVWIEYFRIYSTADREALKTFLLQAVQEWQAGRGETSELAYTPAESEAPS